MCRHVHAHLAQLEIRSRTLEQPPSTCHIRPTCHIWLVLRRADARHRGRHTNLRPPPTCHIWPTLHVRRAAAAAARPLAPLPLTPFPRFSRRHQLAVGALQTMEGADGAAAVGVRLEGALPVRRADRRRAGVAPHAEHGARVVARCGLASAHVA